VARFLSTVLVVGLLAGTTAAFAVTEGLKLEPSPITHPTFDYRSIAPTCDCESDSTSIGFTLRKADDVTVGLVNDEGRTVRTLVRGVRFPKGRLRFEWDGRDDAGGIVPDGRYRPRVHLARAHRTIVLPNPLTVDTIPPRVKRMRVLRKVVSPDGDRRHDVIQVFFSLNEPARGILFADGRLIEQKRFPKERDHMAWNGRIDGIPLAAGPHRISVAARDTAGNISESRATTIFVRYVRLARHTIRVAPAGRLVVGVSTDAQPLRWRLGPLHGVTKRRRIVVRVPDRAGLYRLVVSGASHSDRARVFVG